MAFDLGELKRQIDINGKVVRIVVTEVKGSAPRDVGTSMMVWKNGQAGTIGGGALEYQAVKAARLALQSKSSWSSSHPLGPDLGQCCGGFVKLATEYFDKTCAPDFKNGLFARPISGGKSEPMPFSVKREVSLSQSQGMTSEARFLDGWLIEPLNNREDNVWVWGAGHVGRAIVHTLHNLPDVQITWIDTDLDRFPENIPKNVSRIYCQKPQRFVKFAKKDANHFILTYSHFLDFEICNALLHHRFNFVGLIGSKTKWSRFKKRLIALGHIEAFIDKITCPIGQPEFGKHPQEIAVGVAGLFLSKRCNLDLGIGDSYEQPPVALRGLD